MKHKVILPIFLLIMLLLNNCKKKDEFPVNQVSVKFLIKNDRGESVSNAKVYIFENADNFNKSHDELKATNAIDSTVSADGYASVDIIPENKYWLLIIYKDPFRKISLLNEDYKYVISQLKRNIDVTVEIKLKAVEGNIGFWTQSQISPPIFVTLAQDTFSLLSAMPQTPEGANDPNILSVNKKAGTYRYRARNASGCIWTGRVILKNGEFMPVELQACENGEVVFWTETANINHLPIKITLNDVDLVGSLNQTRSDPYTCGDLNKAQTIFTGKESGLYTYFAESADGKCVWTGSFEVKPNECTSIGLKECK